MIERNLSERPRRVWGIMIATFALIGVGSLLVWGFVAGRSEAALEAQREQPVKAPNRVLTVNGEPVIRLDAETLQRNGIETATLSPTPYHNQIRAYGLVLDIARLTDLSNNYTNAKAQLQTAQAKLAASKAAYERTQELYQRAQTATLAQFQSTEATFRTDQATLVSADAAVRTLTATAYQEWGPVLGKSLLDGSSIVARLIERQDFLLQVTLPPGSSVRTPPATGSLHTDGARRVEMKYVSPATRTDPKIQGVSFFYITPADSGVLPGMNVLVFLPSATTIAGVMIPASAIIWWQDRAWVYVRSAPDLFTRVVIPTDLPAPGGGYVVKNIPKDAKVVTGGAQLLLSEEFRAQVQVSGD